MADDESRQGTDWFQTVYLTFEFPDGRQITRHFIGLAFMPPEKLNQLTEDEQPQLVDVSLDQPYNPLDPDNAKKHRELTDHVRQILGKKK